MKRVTLALAFLTVTTLASHAQLFVQDFASGGTTATYVNASPTNGQWNAITTTGANKAWGISSNTLTLTSTGANSAFASRTTDFASTPTGVKYTFDFNLASSSTASTNAFEFSIGSGFTTNNSTDTNASVYAKFGINTTTSTGFSVRDISGSTSGATTFGTGSTTLTWVLNNTGSTFSYLAPDGSTESIANDTWDLWVGTSRQLNDRTVTTASQSMTDFKLGATGTHTTSASFDNFNITAIPEPSTYALIGLGLGGLVLLRRKKNLG